MVRRLVDALLAGLALVVTAPLLALAAVGIRRASPGPVLYRAERVGRGGRPFIMYKLRTMHSRRRSDASRITGAHDPRVFPLGAWLRAVKLDELPQLINVLKGEMAIVGPRPEDPAIVARHYDALGRETLTVRPGLASPGSIYSSTHGDALLTGTDPEAAYAERLLPVKLALDVVYVRHASLAYDARIVGRTLWVIVATLAGRRRFADPPELAEARRLLSETAAWSQQRHVSLL
ncbi:MAG: sugar transferase [Gemmatimonadetes bacterium]|nr:MAG: sugar transferase [Gemmatimonadota bacterium]PYO96397.1 MAG: sugar transferase [Gemmatimonadota bacterium]TLY55571.1 MAG: sugar transferase [Gemmatimonadota bacterium]